MTLTVRPEGALFRNLPESAPGSQWQNFGGPPNFDTPLLHSVQTPWWQVPARGNQITGSDRTGSDIYLGPLQPVFLPLEVSLLQVHSWISAVSCNTLLSCYTTFEHHSMCSSATDHRPVLPHEVRHEIAARQVTAGEKRIGPRGSSALSLVARFGAGNLVHRRGAPHFSSRTRATGFRRWLTWTPRFRHGSRKATRARS